MFKLKAWPGRDTSNGIAPLCSRWTSRGHADAADAWDSKCVVYYSRSTAHATTDVFLKSYEASDKQMVLCKVVKRRMLERCKVRPCFNFYWLHTIQSVRRTDGGGQLTPLDVLNQTNSTWFRLSIDPEVERWTIMLSSDTLSKGSSGASVCASASKNSLNLLFTKTN